MSEHVPDCAGWEDCHCFPEYDWVWQRNRADRAEARAEVAEAEARRAGEANAALLRERNTWARQLVDARDEADDARKGREAAHDRAAYLDSERTAEQIRAEDAEAALSRVLADVEALADEWGCVCAGWYDDGTHACHAMAARELARKHRQPAEDRSHGAGSAGTGAGAGEVLGGGDA